jgi:SAM-dependent methyltransferase
MEDITQARNDLNFRDYIFGTPYVDDRERLVVQHDIFKHNFVQMVEKVLLDYGLAQKLEQAKAIGSSKKVRILDVGCGEGSFLHDVAEILQARGLLEVAELIGFDKDAAAIAMAQDLYVTDSTIGVTTEVISETTAPFLQFYVQDATDLSNTDNPALADRHFDFIYALMVFEHIPNAKRYVEELYDHWLVPGGAIYLRDALAWEGENSWLAPLPAMAQQLRAFKSFIVKLNEGKEVASEEVTWLRDLGAIQVQTFLDLLKADLTSDRGLEVMGHWVMMIRNSLPRLVSGNLLSQEQANTILDDIYQNLEQANPGYWGTVNTLAQKPL